MSFEAVEVQRYHRPQLQQILTNDLPTSPDDVRLNDGRDSSITSSISAAETVIPWVSPPSRARSPQRTPQQTPQQTPHSSHETLTELPPPQPVGVDEAAYASHAPLVVRFDEEQIRSDEAEASKKGRRMDAGSSDSGPPTPNTDDTPYIRFAIEQLTRDEEVRAIQTSSSERSSDTYPVERIIDNHLSDDHIQHGSIHTREELALARKYRSSPGPGSTPPRRLFRYNATRPLSRTYADGWQSDILIPVDPPLLSLRYPDLRFVPTILRPIPMFMIALLCVLMIAAIMFCAIYSASHEGLESWGYIYGGEYFVFGFLPQISAAVIWMAVQEVMRASRRILPFTLMAMNDAERRSGALFLKLYQKSLLLPGWNGSSGLDLANVCFWLLLFTIPLQSCLFSVVYVDATWRWTAVQGVAWCLVAIYVLVLIGLFLTALFFSQRPTGLMWDPQSLADVIALLPRSNSLKDFAGTEVMRSRDELQQRLRSRSDRLGFWKTPNRSQGIFYCIGEAGALTRTYTLERGKLHEKSPRLDSGRSSDVEKCTLYNEHVRFRFIPWYLRDTYVMLWSVAAFFLLLALIITSFLPSTALRNGFNPRVASAPNSQGFSAADFLYSFVPSTLGLFLYLFFQTLDMSLRQLQPWAELGRNGGGTADESLLSDYATRSPLGCAWSAFNAGHYRLAITSLLSFLFIVLPVLAGGIFFALTTPSGEVRMMPNLPAYYFTLAILILYLLGLLILIPNRRLLRLPHAVDCLAEIFSFVHNSQMLDDAAFRAPRSQADLVTRLMSARTGGRNARYEFGVHQGRDGTEWMGIERVGRDGYRRQWFANGV